MKMIYLGKDSVICKTLRILDANNNNLYISNFHSMQNSLDNYSNNEFFSNDVFILDVDFLNGLCLEISKLITENDSDKIIILIDSNSKYVLEGYRYNVYRYIKKNIFIEKINEYMKEYLKEYNRRRHDHYLILEYKGTVHKLKFREILYCISYDNYIYIETINNSYKFRKAFRTIKHKFVKSIFVEINRGIIINHTFIIEIDKKSRTIYLENGQNLIASKAGIYKIINLF